MSDDNDSDEEFVPKRRSVKNTIASDDENGDSDTSPIYTEDITLHLSEDEDNEGTREEPNPCLPSDDTRQDIISSDFTEGLNAHNSTSDISPGSRVRANALSTVEAKQTIRAPYQSLIDSDSEPDESSEQSFKPLLSKDTIGENSCDAQSPKRKEPKSLSKPTKRKHRSMWDSDSDEDVETVTKSPSERSSLFDSDSDDAVQPEENIVQERTKAKACGKSKKSATGTQKKGSSKDAMLTIRSESQRMTRESAISLPYHRPKQHSLSEFLNRPRLVLPSMKASVEELIKFQEGSKKGIEEFYQSESEHSDDDKDNDPDWNDEGDKNEKKNETEVQDKSETREGNEKECDGGRHINTIIKEVKEAGKKSIGDNEIEVRDVQDNAKDNKKDPCIETEIKDCEGLGIDKKNDAIEETEVRNCQDVEMDTDDVVMETEVVGFDEKSEDHNEIKEGDNEGNEEKRWNGVVDMAKEEEEKPGGAETKDEKDTPKIDKEVESKAEGNTNTASCSIDSQDLRLKYSEDLSEAIENRKMNFDPISDSDDEDVQELKKPSKPKEEPKLILRGNPNDVIDLDDDFTTFKSKSSEDLEGLKKRFVRHSLSSKPKASPQTLAVNVVDLASDGSIKGINEETVTWTTEKAPVDNTPPGLKMKMLKMELQRKIVEQREKEFEKKVPAKDQAAKEDNEDGDDLVDDGEEDGETAEAADDEAVDGEGDDAGDEFDIGEEDEIDGDVEDETDEEDDGEGILERSQKKEKRSTFVDDEASVDDDNMDDRSVDLEEEEEEEEENKNPVDAKKSQFSRTNSNVDMFSSQMSDEDDMIPGYQPCGGRRNASPVSELHSAATCSAQNSNEPSRLPESTQNSPNSSFQRILRFANDFNSQNTDISTTQILTSYSEEKNDGIMQLAQSPEAPETEADLMAMCSGQFITQPFSLESQGANLARPDNPIPDSQDSQDVQLKWTEDSPTSTSESSSKVGKARFVIESSDEDTGDEEETTAKRKTKRLSFSDEESNSVGADDFINDEEEEEAEDDPEPAYVMYDSDENEIPVKGAAAFLENEAELSEDEYAGSGDEDEGGHNDQMEEELGDLDEFDQDKVREELGRIHMRNLLDDDRRDVRLMQEMLLEDGEFHEDGKGRQRQFKWKNVDSATLLASQADDSDEEKVDEDEDDGEWRQNRHKREMFLAEVLKDKKGKSVEIEVEEQEDSELILLGKSVLKRMSSTRVEVKETVSKPQQPSAIPDSPMKSLFARGHSRGSFLTRTSDVLTRLAENASGKNGIVETKTKNSRNFVFAAISPPKQSEKQDDIENEAHPNAKRKLLKRSLIAQPEKKMRTSLPTEYTGLFNYL